MLIMKKRSASLLSLLALATTSAFASPSTAPAECAALPGHAELRAALTRARQADNGGFDLDMWGTVVSRSGTICAVAFTGRHNASQWPGSRAISAQKANTANAFSLPALALATANLYSATQPGGSLFGLQESNPVNAALAYAGPASAWGQHNDPLVGQRMGGINVFGGGLALYDGKGELLGALGVSGDSSCADHAIAWRTRHLLTLDYVPAGVGPGGMDQISYDGDWKQPHCGNAAHEDTVVQGLPATRRQ
jgi:uncharacterized protein GlcG (DUF336 family)